jgi:DNA-binding PadR family transcriptional regulator
MISYNDIEKGGECMPKKAMEQLTESMFYVLMALTDAPRCGIDIAEAIEKKTAGRVRLGPATLYTLLAKFEKEKYICEKKVEGRRRTYAITARGLDAYHAEVERLRACLSDAERGEEENHD